MVTLQLDKLLKKPKPAPEKPKQNASEPIVLNTTATSENATDGAPGSSEGATEEKTTETKDGSSSSGSTEEEDKEL